MGFPLQVRLSVRRRRHHRDMFQVLVACSSCEEETEVLVEDLEAVDREVCPCGYSYVVLAVSEFEPVYAQQAQVIQLPHRQKLSNAA